MKTCEVCGNDIEATVWTCPFCEQTQSQPPIKATALPKQPIVTVNLKQGLPTVEAALTILDRKLAAAQLSGARLVRLIHGWGSSGTGGGIKVAARSALGAYRRTHRIRGFTPGEEYSELTCEGRRLLSAFPALKKSLTTDRNNQGITFVEF